MKCYIKRSTLKPQIWVIIGIQPDGVHEIMGLTDNYSMARKKLAFRKNYSFVDSDPVFRPNGRVWKEYFG